MDKDASQRHRYLPRSCTLRGCPVWAIATPQPDSSWKIVNCLDKDTPCFNLECAFTTDGGQWPFQGVAANQPLTDAR